MASKQDIINNVYFDRSGFQSKAETLKDAKKKDASITLEDINKFFRENVEQKKKPRGENSFIPSHSFFEFQFDLFFINDIENQKFKVGALMIDVFSKFMTVVAIKSKSEGDVASALIECFNKMGGFCELLYTDDESALNTKSIQDYLKEHKIQHYRTRGHSQFSERAIRTFKDQLYKRVEADEKKGKTDIQWHDYIFQILITYNTKTKSSATGFTPQLARLKKNELEVKLNIASKAKRNRIYPELNERDKVKIYRKKGITEKERSSTWSKNDYTITKIQNKLGQKYYYVDGMERAYLRHELLKV